MKQTIRHLKKKGFKRICILNSLEEVAAVEIVRQKLWNNKKELSGPFDIIGDVHGCLSELRVLLTKLGYKITKHRDRTKNYGYTVNYHLEDCHCPIPNKGCPLLDKKGHFIFIEIRLCI